MSTVEAERVVLSGARRYHLHSDAVGETFQIDVALPATRPSAGQALPVIYVMDANTVFGIAAQAIRFLQQGDGVRPVLLVGVGYCLDGVVRARADYGALRMRDLTPSVDVDFVEQVLRQRRGSHVSPAIELAGGANDFLTFLVDELRPFIAEQYDVDPTDQTLVGSSLGGLFCLNTLFSRPAAFQRYVANSPSIWWRDRELFERECELAAGTVDLQAGVFMSVGSEENQAPWTMVDDMQRLASTLRSRAYPSLDLTAHVFDGESHTSVIPAALSRGLRAVLARRD